VYQEGIYSGISMALRIFSLTTWAMVFIMTSHPSDIFTSLKRVGMPYTLNFILIMTLQLIPILQNEFVVVLNAQKSRAMKGTGFGALLPSMVPVFVGAIERIQQLSISLESRAFGSSGHKTSYRRVRITVWDILNLLLAVVVSGLATYWVIVDKSLDWSRTLVFNPVFSAILIGISVTGFLTYMGLAIYLVAKS
jgi:energy-coupling factor transport system permease protein